MDLIEVRDWSKLTDNEICDWWEYVADKPHHPQHRQIAFEFLARVFPK